MGGTNIGKQWLVIEKIGDQWLATGNLGLCNHNSIRWWVNQTCSLNSFSQQRWCELESSRTVTNICSMWRWNLFLTKESSNLATATNLPALCVKSISSSTKWHITVFAVNAAVIQPFFLETCCQAATGSLLVQNDKEYWQLSGVYRATFTYVSSFLFYTSATRGSENNLGNDLP